MIQVQVNKKGIVYVIVPSRKILEELKVELEKLGLELKEEYYGMCG